MIVDVNLLLYASDEQSPFHDVARSWLTERLNGSSRTGLPWSSLSGFLRISTNARLSSSPLTADEAWEQVHDWLAPPTVWVPAPTERHAEVFSHLMTRHRCTANLVPDAELAALAVEHGVPVASADTGFALFTPELTWVNPLV